MIDVRELAHEELRLLVRALPLHRFGARGLHVRRDLGRRDAVGHVHVAWRDTELSVPELQEMYVLPERRGGDVGTAVDFAPARSS